MGYYDRYRQALGLPLEQRTDALIQGVQGLARSQAQTEYQILRNIDPIVQGELQQLIDQQLQQAQQQPATMWDLLRSEQTQRLAMLKIAFDLRVIMIGGLTLLIGAAIGSAITIALFSKPQLTEVTPWQQSVRNDY
jgi:hypothetical protein